MLRSRIGLVQKVANVRPVCLHCGSQGRLPWRPLPAGKTAGFVKRPLSTTRSLRAIPTDTLEPVDTNETVTEQTAEEASKSNTSGISQAELETYRDIREYLHKWLETNPLVLDPIQDAGNKMSAEAIETSIGTMLNGRDHADSLWTSSNLRQEEDFDTSEESEGQHLEPGDLVARLYADGVFGLAIYVRSVNKQKQFYTARGNWRICSNREIDFVMKGFAPPELLEPIIPYFPDEISQPKSELQIVPEGGLPRPLGAPLITMMNNFSEHMADFYRDHSRFLDNAYELVADEAEFLRLSIDELTMKLLGIEESELNAMNLFAVHQAVRRFPFKMERDIPSYFSRTYLIQPKRISKVVDQVSAWVRDHQEMCIRSVMGKPTVGAKDHPMYTFIQKAQRMIRLSRKVRSPTIMSSVGPSSQQFKPAEDGKSMIYREVLTERFTATDQTILEFMQYYVIPSVIMPSGTLRSAASHIMRATGMYNTLGLSEASTRLFLQELGVISPWENLGVLDQSLLLPGHGMSLLEDMKWEEIEESCQDLSLTDSMQHLRKDWGDLPVYCVDDVTAQEIDDGVSVERIPNSDDTFWVRIHVANPTAFLDPDHPIIEYASSRVATTYVPERTYPILPSALTQGHFSLSAGRPTLTFSAKMNLQGEILDTEVVNGTVHNVISITHRTVREFLNPNAEKSSKALIVGDSSSITPPPSDATFRNTLTPEDKESFTILRKLMQGFRTQRQKNGAMDLPQSRPNPSVSLQFGTQPVKPYEMQVTEGRYFVGDPIISLGMQDSNPHEVRDESKNYLISLLMNLAGHIAGRFCADRGIPTVFDGTWYDPEYTRVTNENIAQFGGQAFYHSALPKALSMSAPVQHHILGLDAYVKCTSPLRRFTDVIAHYQIEAALRFEAENGRKFAATDIPTELSELEPDETQAQIPVVGDIATSKILEENPEPDETPTQTETQKQVPVEDDIAPSEILEENPVPNPPSPLPYTQFEINDYIVHAQQITTRLREISTFANQHWACMLLFRAFYFGECELPSSFPVLLRTKKLALTPGENVTKYSAVITNLGVSCTLTVPEDCPGKEHMDVFGVVEARLTAVDMATLEVSMEAKRFVRAFERTGEWA
ncbi:hypothetical protein N7532_002277 [Penicillium argentinense]|uniref:RNB domain-containing protein n=1 Tax=Penicillium argentinense TaxID=1131581 RepID=A0A9W9G067_9EURO|nr:uncharacterized protein N7532_002277 [Penicillium argentinense]KAJ5109632.1 hypothetical protein N7532_002277 [Penicillium argentinense]